MIIVAAAFFAVMGLAALIAPARFAAPLGLTLDPRRGPSEIRAVYGAFGLAMAALILAVVDQPALRSGVYLTLAVALYAMAAGRLISALVDRGMHPLMALLAVGELTIASILLWQRDIPAMPS